MSRTTPFSRCPLERACDANLAGENNSFIFTFNVQTVPPYHFQLVFVVLHLTVKEFFVTQSQNWRNGRFLNLQSFSTNHAYDSWFHLQLNCRPSLENDLFFCLSVFVATVSMPCIRTRHQKSYVSWKFSNYFSLRGMNE